jgi:hypothetical protein
MLGNGMKGQNIDMDIKIIIATHKKYQMPTDKMYLPLHVGREGKSDMGYVGDNTGDNVSDTNPRLCELTGIYWAWKNLKADYIGLVHYRRYFTNKSILHRVGKDKFQCIISSKEAESILNKYDLILPRQRKYYIESLYSHFVHLPYTYEKDIEILRDVIKELSSDYLDAFDIVMHRTHAHMFNMFIMKKEWFDKYCEWLFPIIFETDKRIDTSGYTAMEARAVAYFGEFMIDVWNEKQRISYKELPVMFMEKQNWVVKGGKFLMRKIGLKKK